MAAVQLLFLANQIQGLSQFAYDAEMRTAGWCIGGERMQRGRGAAVRSPLGALVKLQVSAAGGNTAYFLNREP